MSTISKQVKILRECTEECNNPLYDMKMKRIAKLMNEAANTIEELSAELTTANVELKLRRRSIDCDGEWIYCGDKDHFSNESRAYYAVFDSEKIFERLNFNVSDSTWSDDR